MASKTRVKTLGNRSKDAAIAGLISEVTRLKRAAEKAEVGSLLQVDT